MIFILCAIIMLQAGILYRLWQQRRQAELLARNRLRYIEEWLDLLYLYNNDPVSFHTRCKELASVKRLSNYHIGKDGAFRHVGKFPVLNILLGTGKLLQHGFIAHRLPELRGFERIADLVALIVRGGIDQPVILASAYIAMHFLHRHII